MSDFHYIYYSLKSRFLNSSLSILLTSFGLLIALLISQFSNHVENRINEDGKGIDIVVGAKGSPLQLVLSTIYHIDIPTGNISYKSAQEISKNPLIEKAIPIALGDNWKGHRIVGTSLDYIKHFNAQIQKGKLWENDFEMVAGANINVKLNDNIVGAHGITGDGGVHDEQNYKIVGILKSTNSVLDRLLFTSVNSVLEIHGLDHLDHHEEEEHHDHHEEEEHHDHHKEEDDHKDHGAKENKNNWEYKKIKNSLKTEKLHTNSSLEPEITALLIKTKSPIANINLPRSINRETNLQAANPALEITRLTAMLGLGSKSFTFLSFLLISIAILSIFSGLASNLDNRMGDLAILRAIGYSKKRIFKIIAMEGAVIVFFGIFLGIIMGVFSFEILSELITPLNVSEAKFSFDNDFYIINSLVLIAGFIASIVPAIKGSKISVANQLSQNI